MIERKVKTTYDIGQKLSDDPVIYVFDDFISSAEANIIIEAAEPNLKRAVVSSAKKGIESAGRTGQNCWVKQDHNETIAEISQRVSELVGLPLENAESLQVIHYGTEQKYNPHYDGWRHDTESGKRCMKRGGQRLVTCLIYLNNVEAGGGTEFPKINLEVEAKLGRMVVFHNCYAGTNQRHDLSQHGGMAVKAGEKWACNLWFREEFYAK